MTIKNTIINPFYHTIYHCDGSCLAAASAVLRSVALAI